jgi:hypothetical protein
MESEYIELIKQLPNNTLYNQCLKCYYLVNDECDVCEEIKQGIYKPVTAPFGCSNDQAKPGVTVETFFE